MKYKKLIGVVLSSSLMMSGCGSILTEEQQASLSKAGGAILGGVAANKLAEDIDNDFVRAAVIFAGAAAGAYIGDQFAKALSKKDQEKLFEAQQQAASSDKPVTFTGEEGVSGRVSVVKDKPVQKQEKTVKVKVLKDKVEQTPPLELVGAPYSSTKFMNVRSGPGTDYKVVTQLKKGQSVQVIGKALPKKTWFLISQLPDGTAGGYAYSSLMTASTKPVDYVSTPAQQVSQVNVQASGVCKTVRQEVTTASGVISEDLRVCQQGDGTWKMV